MKAKWLLTLCIVFASLYATANDPGKGDNSSSKTDIAGGVFDYETKKPIGNVAVTAYSNNKKEKAVLTDIHGNFSFDTLKPGTYRFVFEKDGYKKVSKEKVIVRSDEGLQLSINMEEHAIFDFMPGPSSLIDFE
jgi:hypothetical protein